MNTERYVDESFENYRKRQDKADLELKRKLTGHMFFLSLPPGHMNRAERRKEGQLGAAKGRTYRKDS